MTGRGSFSGATPIAVRRGAESQRSDLFHHFELIELIGFKRGLVCNSQ
jgi:hypothetical protein